MQANTGWGRRQVLAGAGAALACGASGAGASFTALAGRPAPAERRFVSPAVEAMIARVSAELGTRGTAGKLARMFARCYPNTLDTTIEFTDGAGPDTFVITGDIPAMWLRDSAVQVWCYLPLADQDERLRRMIAGVIRRHARSILLDPYANAFNRGPTPSAEFADDRTDMKPGLHERKWEADSLGYAVELSWRYWRATGDTAPFDPAWAQAMRLVVATWRTQQRRDGAGPYHMMRRTFWTQDSGPNFGYGNPTRYTGMVASVFRPSDEAAIFPFIVPVNMFLAVALDRLRAMAGAVLNDAALARDCAALATDIRRGIARHGEVTHPVRGRIWAYEVDGYGNHVMMDHADVPSLVSAPYWGWCAPDDPLYRRTRAFALSADNQWFVQGRAGEGVGALHTPGMIWPIGLMMRALTASDDREAAAALRTLANADAGTGFVHTAFDKDDPSRYLRAWVAWNNSLFGEMVLRLRADRPALLRSLQEA